MQIYGQGFTIDRIEELQVANQALEVAAYRLDQKDLLPPPIHLQLTTQLHYEYGTEIVEDDIPYATEGLDYFWNILHNFTTMYIDEKYGTLAKEITPEDINRINAMKNARRIARSMIKNIEREYEVNLRLQLGNATADDFSRPN